MKTALQVFAFDDHVVRVIDVDETPWFVANDVCAILDYANPRDAIAKHCKKDGVAKRDTIDRMGRTQPLTYINEGNLYRLIIKSRKPDKEIANCEANPSTGARAPERPSACERQNTRAPAPPPISI